VLSQPHPKTASASRGAVEYSGHCRRTAAVAKLIGHHLFLPSEEKDLLRAACLLHHHNISALAPGDTELLLAEIFGGTAQALAVEDRFPGILRGVLNANEVPAVATALESRLASILWLADAFDQQMKGPPSEGDEVGEILERLRGGVEAGLWPEESIDALVHCTSPVPIGPWRVPVFPQAALRTLRLMRDPRVCLSDVVDAAKLDPATAGLVMQLANSALFGSRTPIATLSNAISRLGFATSQKVIMSAALRPVFSSPKLQATWQHSLEVADLSEQLAARTGTIDPGEAYLGGLVHDVGRIALEAMPLYDSARLQGLLHGGCPQVYAEKLLVRTDHAALGAQIAAEWRLPETMVSAIRHHHRPERAENPLAYLLYVAEYVTGAEEDLPSVIRLESSLKGIGIEWDDVRHYTVSTLGSWMAAA
jgi:putative nucleotidyltransferase with HDIG domain